MHFGKLVDSNKGADDWESDVDMYHKAQLLSWIKEIRDGKYPVQTSSHSHDVGFCLEDGHYLITGESQSSRVSRVKFQFKDSTTFICGVYTGRNVWYALQNYDSYFDKVYHESILSQFGLNEGPSTKRKEASRSTKKGSGTSTPVSNPATPNPQMMQKKKVLSLYKLLLIASNIHNFCARI